MENQIWFSLLKLYNFVVKETHTQTHNIDPQNPFSTERLCDKQKILVTNDYNTACFMLPFAWNFRKCKSKNGDHIPG